MTLSSDIFDYLDTLSPAALALDWDNSGLQVGSRNAPVRKILVALDPFEDVCREAAAMGAELVITHHPLFFNPIKSLTDESAVGRAAATLIQNGIGLFSCHTNLDIAPGGVNDCLACTLGLQDTKPLNEEKIGRIGTLSCEKPLEQFLSDVVKLLSCNGLRYRDGGRPVHRVAVGGGACGEYIPQAIAQGCDTFVTSDMRYNDFLDTQGLNLIDAGHFPTEDVVCQEIVRRLRETFPELEVTKSAVHGDAVKFYMR